MTIIKQLFVAFAMLCAVMTTAFAAEATSSPSSNVTETIGHIEQALVEISKSDFSASNLHLKAARAAAEKIVGDAAVLKEANNGIIQGQIESKKGDIAKSTALLNKSVALYKSL